MLERFDRSDYRFLLVCGLILVAGVTIGLLWFDSAFPEASIEFKVGRGESRLVAEDFLAELGIDPGERRHASKFDFDNEAKVFLERTIGLKTKTTLGGI